MRRLLMLLEPNEIRFTFDKNVLCIERRPGAETDDEAEVPDVELVEN